MQCFALLKEKAEKEKQLNHVDRLTILSVFNHLGKAGQQSIHEIIRHTLNYDFRITEKWIQRKRGFPVSCPKIREWQSHITPSVGCYCKFKELPNSYPSPVLHVDPEFIIKIKAQPEPVPQKKSALSYPDQTSTPEKSAVLKDSSREPALIEKMKTSEKLKQSQCL